MNQLTCLSLARKSKNTLPVTVTFRDVTSLLFKEAQRTSTPVVQNVQNAAAPAAPPHLPTTLACSVHPLRCIAASTRATTYLVAGRHAFSISFLQARLPAHLSTRHSAVILIVRDGVSNVNIHRIPPSFPTDPSNPPNPPTPNPCRPPVILL